MHAPVHVDTLCTDQARAARAAFLLSSRVDAWSGEAALRSLGREQNISVILLFSKISSII